MEQQRTSETAQKVDTLKETAVFTALVLEQLLQDIYGAEAGEKIYQARRYAALTDHDLTEKLTVSLQFPGKRGVCAVHAEVPGKLRLVRCFAIMDLRAFQWQNHLMMPQDQMLEQLNFLARFCRELTA